MGTEDIFEDIFDEADALNNVAAGSMKTLSDQVRALRHTEGEISQVEDHLKGLKAQRHKLASDMIPALMDEMGIERVDVDGVTVVRKLVVSASIPVDRREEAYEWLRTEHLDDIIKNDVLLSFGKGEDNIAGDAFAALQERGYSPERKTHIHPQTLKAFVKERIEHGRPIDLEMFGAFINNMAEIRRK